MLRLLSPRTAVLCCILAWLFMFVISTSGRLAHEVIVGLAVVVGSTGVGAGLYLFLRGFRLLAWKRCIEDTPLTKIGAAAVGQVKVFGRVTGSYTLISPVAGVECYYYRTVAWDGRDAQDDADFEGSTSETLFTPFSIADETGALMVDPRGTALDLPAEFDGQVAGDLSIDGSARFLQRHGLSIRGQTRVTEYTIKPGDSLLILGCLGENRGLGSIATSSRMTGGTYLSPEAAEMQREEQLELLGIPASDLPTSCRNGGMRLDDPPRMVLGAGDGRQPFVLARTTPQRMIDSLTRRSTAHIWSGPIVAILSLALLVWWLGVW